MYFSTTSFHDFILKLCMFLILPIDAEHATHPFTFMGKDELKFYIKTQSVPRTLRLGYKNQSINAV